MRRKFLKTILAAGLAAFTFGAMPGPAKAQSLLDKIKNGETVRIGFSNEIPWAYPGENNEPLGFVNAMTLDLLEKMGTTKIEPIVTEWGSLIPGLQAGRFDIITGGMYILPERCRNALFTEPLGTFADALLVPVYEGGKGLNEYGFGAKLGKAFKKGDFEGKAGSTCRKPLCPLCTALLPKGLP